MRESDGGLRSERCKLVLLTSPEARDSCSSKKTTISALSGYELHTEYAGDDGSLLDVVSWNDL